MTKGKTPALVPIQERPYNAETPLEALTGSRVPTQLFYVRNHFDVPKLEPEAWRLSVDGEVENPVQLSMEELSRLPRRSVLVTLECAGNGRSSMVPLPPGTPWRYGAVGTAQFTGTPLSTLLDLAGIRAGVVEVLFLGADEGEVEPGRTERFARSLRLEKALHPDTLLTWSMNDGPLPPDHGFPLRLVVPGWYGMASVKWLVGISALSQPFEGFFQKDHYVYAEAAGAEGGQPVTTMKVRSIIGQPADRALVGLGPLEVAGTAWTGERRITRVEVSADDGLTWEKAELGRSPSPYAATPWRFLWTPSAPGAYTLMARATDSAGHTQPRDPVWNLQGYGNNLVHRIRVSVGERSQETG